MARHERIAGAPISWGVCEVPGWGYQMDAERVLHEMVDVGLRATEAGPEGFLPADPRATRDALAARGLELVGGFVPAVLHETADGERLEPVRRAAAWLRDSGADVLVLAADTREEGYDVTADLDEAQWRHLLEGLDAAVDIAADHDLLAALHPHVGTAVEDREQIERVGSGSRIPWCYDTGHLLIGGTDPVQFAREHASRIAHVQLKDVDAAMAQAVRDAARTYTAAVADGMYRPLGAGDVDVATVLEALERAGYDGWYVLEQDVVLAERPPEGTGPRHDVERSIAFLEELLEPANQRIG